MEETSQQQTQELEYKNPNDDQGGIRRRLRDRDLLRKRKAEAEEKETNQVESQRKRSRAEGSTKKRGRPRKTEPATQLSVVQEEAAVSQEAPAVVVVSEPAEVIPDQIPGSLTPLLAVESQPASVLAAPTFAPGVESVQSPVFASSLVDLTTDTAPAPVQDSAPAPDGVSVPAQSQDSVAAAPPAPPSAPPQVETIIYTEPQGRETLDQVLIEDLGPDEEEDISPSQNKKADEDLSEVLLINVPEQNKVHSVPAFSSAPLTQEYLPGNSL